MTKAEEKRIIAQMRLEGRSVDSIAKETGRSWHTIKRWLEEEEVIEYINERQHEASGAARNYILSALPVACNTLVRVMRDEGESGSARIKAALEILKLAGIATDAPAVVIEAPETVTLTPALLQALEGDDE